MFLRLLGEISLSLLVHTAPGVQLWIGTTSVCRLPEGVCSCPDRMGLNEQLIMGLWLAQASGRLGYGMQG